MGVKNSSLPPMPSAQEGIDYLEANKSNEGVNSLASGLQYKVLRAGDGKFHPTVNSPCECHYSGTLINGSEFDSSYARGKPSTFAPKQVIKGWTEAMQLMVEGTVSSFHLPLLLFVVGFVFLYLLYLFVNRVLALLGDKWEMYLPSDLAYGQRGSPPNIPPNSVLIFTMEIVKIKGDKVPA
jgi:FKBP-type peptidyl-prolyl cis-trans isomerase FklB